ncbi:MAG TPA: DUF2279 domain-containing protein [Chryseosolibacter sp.]|nr:DUF2279 domain-containing protein [Chryseosolibacter sp.]
MTAPIKWLRLFLTIMLLGFSLRLTGQAADSLHRTLSHVDQKKLRTFVIASATGYTAAMVGLHHVWYSGKGRQPFTFFNDNAEWKQLDKSGHALSAFHVAHATAQALRSCNVPARKANLYGSLTGFAVMLPIEVFDGHSRAYGASVGDIGANATGAGLFLLQTVAWGELHVHPKFSVHHTPFAQRRPDVLGENDLSRLFKDYNGQTYWLSFDMDKFLRFPQWLNLAVGYGAEGMLYGRDKQNWAIGLDPKRQYYLALDVDLTSVKTRSKVVKALLFVGNMIKIPGPAVEFGSGSARFHAFYF